MGGKQNHGVQGTLTPTMRMSRKHAHILSSSFYEWGFAPHECFIYTTADSIMLGEHRFRVGQTQYLPPAAGIAPLTVGKEDSMRWT